MASWPGTLPQDLLLEGLGKQREPGTIRSQMETGPAKVRRRTTAPVVRLSGQLVLTGTQVGTLETFHNSTLGEGADSFTWTDPEDDGTVTLRFVQPPAYSAVAGHGTPGSRLWAAQLELEIIPS